MILVPTITGWPLYQWILYAESTVLKLVKKEFRSQSTSNQLNHSVQKM